MTVIGLQFGSMRHELATLHKQLDDESKIEHRLQNQMRTVQAEMNRVEKEERQVKAKETELEKRI